MNVLSCTRLYAAAVSLQQSGETAISRLIFFVVVEFHLCPRLNWDPFVLKVVCSWFTLCSPVNGGHLKVIPAPCRQCLLSLGDHLLNGGTHRSQTDYLGKIPGWGCQIFGENSWLRLSNTLLKPSQERLELTEMEYATVFGKELLPEVVVVAWERSSELSVFGHLKF